MIDRSLTIDDLANNHGEPSPGDGQNGLSENLEQRVHRLEDAVAALQDTRIIEERIEDRVLGKMSRKKEAEGTGIVEAERRTAIPTPVIPAPAPAAPVAPTPQVAGKPSWVFVEAFRDIRTCLGMFFDSRYRVSWGAYFSLFALAYVLVSHWLWSLWIGIPLLGLLAGPVSVPVLGAILDKALGLLFAVIAFKCLVREMRRYKEAITGKPPHYSPYR